MQFPDVKLRKRDEIKKFSKIVLFGAGSYLDEVLESFKKYNIVAIFDNKTERGSVEFKKNIKIMNPKDGIDQYMDSQTAVVMSVCSYQYEIAVDLVKNYHIKEEQIFSMCADYQEERMYNSELIFEHLEELRQVREMLADEDSKEYLDNVIRFKLTHNPLYLKPNSRIVGKYIYKMSDNAFIRPREEDYIIDGGAFVGDSVELFMKQTNGRCNIFCFEPFAGNFEKLKELVVTKKLAEKVKIYNAALGNKSQSVSISANQSVSARANVNEEREKKNIILQQRLDDLSTEIERIDFVKLDIEGAERFALQGAENMLRKYKPQMMVSAYHKCDDLWEIPFVLNKIDPNRKIYLGHQPHAGFEPEFYIG